MTVGISWLAWVVACALTAGAHDLWLEPETVPGAKGDDLALHLRLGDQFKTVEERPLQRDHVTRFDLFSDRAKRRDLAATGQEGQAPAAKTAARPRYTARGNGPGAKADHDGSRQVQSLPGR